MQIDIQSKIKDYTLYFADDFGFLSELSAYTPRVVVVDRNVYTLYAQELDRHFSPEEIILFDAVETNKNIQSALALCDKVMAFAAKKNMTIISFGGGITQDVTGFLASVLYRGVNWIFVPTTLLAQSDSCMGSKTSLNYAHFKNLLGSFYPPTKVYINVNFTQTLSETDFYSGLGEVVKLQLMGGGCPIGEIAEEVRGVVLRRDDTPRLRELVRSSLAIKYSYIKDDEFDTGRRNLLNFGHCFGHALETASDYAIPHGIAVVIGIVFANLIAVKRSILDAEVANEIFDTLLLPCIKCSLHSAYFDKTAIFEAMKMDKKRVGTGLPVIVMQGLGQLSKLTDMTQEELYEGIDLLVAQLPIKKHEN